MARTSFSWRLLRSITRGDLLRLGAIDDEHALDARPVQAALDQERYHENDIGTGGPHRAARGFPRG